MIGRDIFSKAGTRLEGRFDKNSANDIDFPDSMPPTLNSMALALKYRQIGVHGVRVSHSVILSTLKNQAIESQEDLL
jgi:hypothetical protein